MSYGTRFTTGGLSVHALCGTGDENIIPTCHSTVNSYIDNYMYVSVHPCLL